MAIPRMHKHHQIFTGSANILENFAGIANTTKKSQRAQTRSKSPYLHTFGFSVQDHIMPIDHTALAVDLNSVFLRDLDGLNKTGVVNFCSEAIKYTEARFSKTKMNASKYTIVKDTERFVFCIQTLRQDGRWDKVEKVFDVFNRGENIDNLYKEMVVEGETIRQKTRITERKKRAREGAEGSVLTEDMIRMRSESELDPNELKYGKKVSIPEELRYKT